jgi:N-acetylglutamate synthase-like GNAT family acetyltransferase
MNVREATEKDVAAISELLIQLAERFIVGGYSEEGRNNLLKSMSPGAIRAYFEQGYRYHVGETDGAIIGVVATKDNSHLFHLFVQETCQGRGYARALWEVAKADCLARGSPGRFTVNSSLNAQDVYRSLGFEPTDGIRDSGGVKFIPMASERTGLLAGSTPQSTEQLKPGGDKNA